MKLETLLEQARTNYYRMLAIVDNNHQQESILQRLNELGWSCFDVTKAITELIDAIPPEKVKLRIGAKIKEWVKQLPDQAVLFNTNILYSPSLGKLNPIGAFKYRSREKDIIVILEGELSGNRVRYSQFGREDFADMDVSEIICVRMEDIDA